MPSPHRVLVPSTLAAMAFLRTSWRRRPLLALITLILLLLIGYTIRAVNDHSSSTPARPNSTTSAPVGTGVALSSLPKEAAETVSLIKQGGPFPYRQDGVVYNNLEQQLPTKPRGYYHEYTVKTPGSADRGARRIVTGKDGQFYYTGNHYQSFVQVNVNE
jgi:ribonuclease T1